MKAWLSLIYNTKHGSIYNETWNIIHELFFLYEDDHKHTGNDDSIVLLSRSEGAAFFLKDLKMNWSWVDCKLR